MSTSKPKPNIYQRINNVMKDVSFVKKEKAQGVPYDIITHDEVMSKLRAKVIEHGIVVIPRVLGHTQSGNNTIVDMTCEFVNIDDPTDTFTSAMFSHGVDKQDKGPGKAISYAYKYCLLKTFMLLSGEDLERDQIPRADEYVEETKTTPKKPFVTTIVYSGTNDQKSEIANIYKSHGVKDKDAMRAFSDRMMGKTWEDTLNALKEELNK